MTTAPFNEEIRLIISAGLLSIFLHWFAFKLNFFSLRLNNDKSQSSISLLHVFTVFAVYVGINIPLALFLGHFLSLIIRPVSLQEEMMLFGTMQFMLSLLCAGLLIAFLKLLPASLTSEIVKPLSSKTSISSDVIIGGLIWILCFPLVIFLSQACELMLSYILPPTPYEQAAVHYFKRMIFSPFLTSITFLQIVVFAPIVEEIIFRGFLLSWLSKMMGQKTGLLLSSLAFSFFHFSPSQGYGNIVILLSLFILAGYLGYAYLRQKSLYTSIALHMIFNLISALRILIGLEN